MTEMLVLCVCLVFMFVGSSEEQTVTSKTADPATSSSTEPNSPTQPAATTPLPGATSTHVTIHTGNTASTGPSPASSTSSQRPAASSGATATTTGPAAGSAVTDTPAPTATTLKGGSASVFGCYSRLLLLLLPATSILIYGAQDWNQGLCSAFPRHCMISTQREKSRESLIINRIIDRFQVSGLSHKWLWSAVFALSSFICLTKTAAEISEMLKVHFTQNKHWTGTVEDFWQIKL